MPTNGLVAFFPFNGNANDASMNQTNGSVSNATLTTNRFGTPNSAYEFSGNSNSYVEFPSTYVQLGRYTYSLWAKINDVPGSGQMAFALNIGGTGGDQSLNIANNYNGGSFNGWLGGGYNTTTPNYALNEDANLSTTPWTHVLCVRDSNFALLYVNGVLVDSLGTTTNRVAYYGSSQVKAFIGKRNDGTGPFDGKIDDVCIYNRALSKKEVEDLYNFQLTSVNDIKVSSVKVHVYPNPNLSTFVIDLSGAKELPKNFTVNITNIIGQVVFSGQYTYENALVEINSPLESGKYIISLLDETGAVLTTETMIVQ